MPLSPSLLDRAVAIAAAYPPIVAALLLFQVVAPQRNGPLAISEVFAPHLLLLVVPLVPLALVSRARALRAGVAVALLVGVARFGPGLISMPPAAASAVETVVTVLSWNLEAGGPAEAELVAVLGATDADVVALQELTPGHAAAIRADPAVAARFPHAAFIPRPGVGGIGLLSRRPILGADESTGPVLQEVEIALDDDTRLTVINTHPFPPRYQVWSAVSIPLDYDATTRDADLVRIRDRVAAAIADGRAVLLVGDFNLTDREPGYVDLAGGLWDAHREVGQGPGSTWRPSRLEFLPFGILRIDHLFGGPGTRPISIGEDCTPRRTDHCILRGAVAVQ